MSYIKQICFEEDYSILSNVNSTDRHSVVSFYGAMKEPYFAKLAQKKEKIKIDYEASGEFKPITATQTTLNIPFALKKKKKRQKLVKRKI